MRQVLCRVSHARSTRASRHASNNHLQECGDGITLFVYVHYCVARWKHSDQRWFSEQTFWISTDRLHCLQLHGRLLVPSMATQLLLCVCCFILTYLVVTFSRLFFASSSSFSSSSSPLPPHDRNCSSDASYCAYWSLWAFQVPGFINMRIDDLFGIRIDALSNFINSNNKCALLQQNEYITVITLSLFWPTPCHLQGG